MDQRIRERHTFGMLSACKDGDCVGCAGDIHKTHFDVPVLVHCICECHGKTVTCCQTFEEVKS